jgi:DNA ligase-1
LFERFKGDVYLQPKFDGLRCQIHKWEKDSQEEIDSGIWTKYLLKGDQDMGLFNIPEVANTEVRLFTRNLEDVTEMFPEIVEAARALPSASFILDSEIVGWNYKKDHFLSYQETMQRRRKYSVENLRESIPVKSFVFDLLYLNGESLVTKDTKVRLDTLMKTFSDTSGGIVLADNRVVSNTKQVKKYFDEYVKMGLEGIIVKQFEGGYKPGVRNFEWVKLKKSMDRELVDTIDMAIVGYYFGSGSRANLGLGAILCAVLNKDTDTLDAICKVGTGMGDELLKDMGVKLSETVTESTPKGIRVLLSLEPDVWVQPKYVVSVDAVEITMYISENGKCLFVGAGLSLSFG